MTNLNKDLYKFSRSLGFININSKGVVAGIINSEGKLWRDQRRFLHDKLRQLGVTYMGKGKDVMEKRIMVSLVKKKIKVLYPRDENILILFGRPR